MNLTVIDYNSRIRNRKNMDKNEVLQGNFVQENYIFSPVILF